MTPDQASTVAAFLLQEIEAEVQTTARVIAAVPDDRKSYTPHDTCMKAGELAEHLLGADLWFLEGVVNANFGPFPESSSKSTAEIAENYKTGATALLEKLKSLSGEQLAAEVTFHGFSLPNVSFLQVMLKHSVHHRGQLTAYLRPMGAKVPSIYGGSADEPLAAAAEQA